MRWLLRKLGYFKVDYGFSCGRHWLQIDNKVIAQTSGDDFYLPDDKIREFVCVLFGPKAWN